MTPSDLTVGDISLVVYVKGLRVTRDNEEFQRVWPLLAASLSPVERRLDSWDGWPDLLAEITRLRPSRLAAEHCLLLDQSSAAQVVARRVRDPHGRPSVVLVSASMAVPWQSVRQVASTLQKLDQAARSVVEYVAAELEADPHELAAALRQQRKNIEVQAVPDGDQSPESISSYWDPLAREVCRYRGIDGVATPTMAMLGANVIVGTEYEAQKLGRTLNVSGYYSRHRRELVQIGETLVPWKQEDKDQADSSRLEHMPPTESSEAPESESTEEVSFIEAIGELADAAYGIEAAVREQTETMKQSHNEQINFYSWVREMGGIYFPWLRKSNKRRFK